MNTSAAPTTAKPKIRLSEMARRNVPMRATYDAAQTNDDNMRHWSAADDMSANAAHNPEIRRILRRRARYEVSNNCIAKGIVATKADYVVGTGPTLQVLTKDEDYNQAIETKFNQWAIAVRAFSKLWQMAFAEIQDGEAFGLLVNNPKIRDVVKLDLRLVEADQVSSPFSALNQKTDGIIFDDFGNPAGYTVLKEHPGELFNTLGLSSDYDTFRADHVLHLFKSERPGQTRGVPHITPALPLFALLRRFTLAVVSAAETAANLAGILKSTAPAGDPEEVEALETIEIIRNMLLTVPQGWDMSQFKAEQPQTTYEMFKRALISEAARCIGQPYGIAAADSSTYNYSSGKLDHLPWFKTLAIDWDRLEDTCVDRLFDAWHAEAVLIPGHLPPSPTAGEGVPAHTWFWDGQELMDPREAGAKETALGCGIDSYPRIFARRGLDWKTEMHAQAEALGMTFTQYQAALRTKLFSPTSDQQATTTSTSTDEETGEEQDGVSVTPQRAKTKASTGSPSVASQELAEFVENYAKSVRSGLITPNIEDEIAFRKRLGLPPVSEAVRQAWEQNDGARQPVTLKSPKAANEGAADPKPTAKETTK